MTQNSGNFTTDIYKSRQNVLSLMKRQGYNVDDYDNFSINEINTMKTNDQLDMILTKNEDDVDLHKKTKVYVRYYLAKALRPNNLQELIEDLFIVEEILSKDDVLFIVVKDHVNETLLNALRHIWEHDKYFIVIQPMARLQFNILEHVLVPPHRVMSSAEVDAVCKRYNAKITELPNISRFDPVAQAICLRPGQVCEITRPSKTAITALYYRYCV